MPQITVHFVRHGETDDNAARRFQMPDAPLSERGREQAAAAAKTLAESVPARALLASDYARTMETAGIIAPALGLTIVPEPALRERHFGIARGRLYADLGEELIASWRDPFVRVPEGESWADVYERIGALIERLRADPPGSEIVLVTHGGAMSVALSLLAGTPVADFVMEPLENCAIRTVTLDSTREAAGRSA